MPPACLPGEGSLHTNVQQMRTARRSRKLDLWHAVAVRDGAEPHAGWMLVALAGAGEWQKGHVAGTLDGDGEGALVLGAGAHLAARLDLAAFADVTPEPGEVL